MASVTSLGIHKPSALPFLEAEGILPSDASEELYTWQTTQVNDVENHGADEELVTTKHCVVWSRGSVIQRIFRFEIEGETVSQALFTCFPRWNINQNNNSTNSCELFQLNGGGKTAELDINANKKTASTPKSKLDMSDYNTDYINWKTDSLMKANPISGNRDPECRALVVIFKTQAHVFYLYGTSYVVHLPFEVEIAFPVSHGILLQRKVSMQIRNPRILQPHSVPMNSSAFAQVSSSELLLKPVKPIETFPFREPDLPPLPLLGDLSSPSGRFPNAGLPRLFSLTDPQTEMGVVVSGIGLVDITDADERDSAASTGVIDERESLLYTSPEDELLQHSLGTAPLVPCLLAVTRNEASGLRTIWKITYVKVDSMLGSQRQPDLTTSGRTSRRRSSYGPGIHTGATTPITRGRESLGVEKPRNQSIRDNGIDVKNDDDLVSQLDPAFENPSAPAKSSRRVSSLLARADLFTSHDKSTFSELASGYSIPSGGRRGTSFGVQGSRLSFCNDGGPGLPPPKIFKAIGANIDLIKTHEPFSKDGLDENDNIACSAGFDKTELDDAVRGLPKEIVFTKIHSIPISKTHSRQGPKISTRPKKPRIFTLKAPDHVLRKESDDVSLFLCIFEYDKRSLTVLPINIQQSLLTRDAGYLDRGDLDQSHREAKDHNFLFGKVTRCDNVIDACKIKDGDCFRILVISESADGICELSLRAPWSTIFKFQLPSCLSLYNPYQTDGDSPPQKREGGFRRILSKGPRYFTALQHESSRGRVDVIDEEGRRHRIQLQLRPHSPYVRNIIKVSESVVPKSNQEREFILRDWWSVASWLRSRSDEEIDIDWTAVVVVLFSMGASLTEDRRAETTTRQRKRKTGLLRSSSGAFTDLESWETMWNEESNLSTSPPWVQDTAWRWALNQNTVYTMPQSSLSRRPKTSNLFKSSITPTVPVPKKSTYLIHCLSLARDFIKSSIGLAEKGQSEYLPYTLSREPKSQSMVLAAVLLGLHLLREEFKLDNLAAYAIQNLTPVMAQIGGWLGWEAWGFNETSYYMLESADMHFWLFDDSVILNSAAPPAPFSPSSILRFIEKAHLEANVGPFISLIDIANLSIVNSEDRTPSLSQYKIVSSLTPRTLATDNLLVSYSRNLAKTWISSCGIDPSTLETLPEGVAVAFRAAISSCKTRTLASWSRDILKITGKNGMGLSDLGNLPSKPYLRSLIAPLNDNVRDVHTICSTTFEVETVGAYDGSAEGDRLAITRIIFKDDQRFAEAAKLLHPLHPPVARCTPEPDWSDTELLEAQQELVKIIAIRTLSVSVGRGLLFYCARMPLLTEKFPIHGFTLSCVMRPANTTVTADRNAYTEEKVSWAFFHAGVEAGLSISKHANGVDTSWILFNKPHELKNRHAGFLLALGLNGHLKSIAKWAIVDYLTPKHTMTSIGLLLGLAASYLGTMNILITRVLSVHVMRMLPPNAAELNLSPLTQTSGIMGIGLLYCNTQHRRMSEIMISEMENAEDGDNSSPLNSLRDEGYRLAAGFALGYINLGRGKDLKGLHDMHIVERLLNLAVGTRKVSVVHIFDKATAAATIAVALIFMKTHDATVARKIDIPDTTHQFDYVRPDVFLLRTVARHLIMWNDIRATSMWMKRQLPVVYRYKLKLTMVRALNTEDMPFFNIVAGLCFSIGLRFAGTGSSEVRNLLCYYLDQFIRICRLPSLNYDGKLSRITVRNCQDVVALAAACVMAGTGDLLIFRRLRALHGRTDVDTPYGSHLAAHLAIGIIFLGGGTHTFGTSNLAIASLLCAFYPLFPNTILDNKSHLQAFRHFWVLAAEPRCLVTRDANTNRPVSLGVKITLHNETDIVMTAPCLLPEFETIDKIQTNDSEYWRVTVDFANYPNHIEVLKRHQSIYVCRRAAYDTHISPFSATMQSLNDSQSALHVRKQVFEWILALPIFARFDRAEKALIFPPNAANTLHSSVRGTVIDDRLVLETGCISSEKSERLWNLRVLFAWADGLNGLSENWAWIGKEVVEGLRAALEVKIKIGGREYN